MLNKLLKYDLKWVYKVLIIFYVLAIFFSILARILFNFFDSLILNIVGQFTGGFAIGMIISALINNFMRIWVRFTRNTYGDESYLTHTLPVEKNTLYLSKILTCIITLFTTVLIALICITIMYYSNTNLEILKSSLNLVAQTFNSTVIKMILVMFIILFLEMLLVLNIGIVGLILGHKSNNNRIIKSIIYGFIMYMLTQGITLFIIYIASLFNKDMMRMFTSNTLSIDSTKTIMYIAIITYFIFNFIYYFIGLKQFKKGVNVE